MMTGLHFDWDCDDYREPGHLARGGCVRRGKDAVWFVCLFDCFFLVILVFSLEEAHLASRIAICMLDQIGLSSLDR
jgi:hypothetical protein